MNFLVITRYQFIWGKKYLISKSIFLLAYCILKLKEILNSNPSLIKEDK